MINLRGRQEPEEITPEPEPIIDRSRLIGSCRLLKGPMCYQGGDKCPNCIRRANGRGTVLDNDYFKERL